jgi:hypothetical protein
MVLMIPRFSLIIYLRQVGQKAALTWFILGGVGAEAAHAKLGTAFLPIPD